MRSRFVYGPVPSRRLGRSLGLDLVPFKTCSYDCVYCQLGRTTRRTLERREYVPIEELLDELAEKLRRGPRPDYLGLAGSGEPTLHAGLGELVSRIKSMTDVPVAVLTNGSLLFLPEVREALEDVDLVLPSLDAGDATSFERVNRPHPDLGFEQVTEGLVSFGERHRGAVWLEVFVLAGITDGEEALRRVAAVVERMRPARVQLNTVARPPAEAGAVAVPTEVLEARCRLFPVPCEVIAEASQVAPVAQPSSDLDDELAALLARRPCTVHGLATGLRRPANEVLKHLEGLCARGVVRFGRRGEDLFYELAR